MADPKSSSFRYGGGDFDARNWLIRVFAKLQGRKVVLLDSDPALCGEVLASSVRKGTFLEHLIAIPAWAPVYSMESMDGPAWEALARDFRKVMAALNWRIRLAPLVQEEVQSLAHSMRGDAAHVVDAEAISRLTLRSLYALVFGDRIAAHDEDLFYRASLEWRKEIAVKGAADPACKKAFVARLQTLVAESSWASGLQTHQRDPLQWLSLFAQPLILSPQINVADIFAALFSFLRADPQLMRNAQTWALANDRAHLEGLLLEAIRLRHPFPILERELTRDVNTSHGCHRAGTQFFILLDRFRQDPTFDASRWLLPSAENPYASLPFAAGPRMCVGKPIALELMVEMLRLLLNEVAIDRLRPEQGHLYSGRDNDHALTAAEERYQLAVFARAAGRSIKIGAERLWHQLSGQSASSSTKSR